MSEAQDVNTRGRNTGVKEKTPSEDELMCSPGRRQVKRKKPFQNPTQVVWGEITGQRTASV